MTSKEVVPPTTTIRPIIFNKMEAAPRSPVKTTKTYLKLQQKLLEIEAEIIQVTNLPSDTPGLDHLAEDIEKKIDFLKKLLTAETASHDSTSHGLSEIEGRLEELEAQFFQSNSPPAILHESDGSESSFVCEHCAFNDELQVPRDVGNDGWKVYENPTMLYDVMMSPSEMFHKPVMPLPSYLEEAKTVSFDCDREQSGGGKKKGRRWCRILSVVMTVSVVSTVGVSSYINNNRQHQGFLTPT